MKIHDQITAILSRGQHDLIDQAANAARRFFVMLGLIERGDDVAHGHAVAMSHVGMYEAGQFGACFEGGEQFPLAPKQSVRLGFQEAGINASDDGISQIVDRTFGALQLQLVLFDACIVMRAQPFLMRDIGAMK